MLKNNSGAALAMVLIILAVGMVIGGIVLFLGAQETTLTYTTENLTRAYYVARSGADTMGEYIINNPNDASDVLNQSSDPVSIGDGTSTITAITPFTEGSVNKIRIVAQGVVPGGYTRTATLVLKRFTSNSIFEYGLFADEDIDGTKIGEVDTTDGSDFPLGSNGTIETDLSPPKPDGDYVVMENQNMDYPEPLFPGDSYVDEDGNTVIPVPLPATQPDITGNGNVVINADAVYNKITKNNGSLTFNVPGNQQLHVVVSTLLLKCPVLITGTGTVHLYVRDGSGSPDADFQTPINIGGDPAQFRLYLEEGSTMELTANAMSYFYVYGPSASVELGSSHSTITGSVIAGSFEANGTPNITYEPLTDTGDDDAINGYLRDRWED